MIEVTSRIKDLYPRAFELARRDKMRVVWLEDDLVYVARRSRGHGRYLVRFFVTPKINGEVQVMVGCFTTTGEECKGDQFNDCCSHIASVILRSQTKKSRKQGRQHEAILYPTLYAPNEEERTPH